MPLNGTWDVLWSHLYPFSTLKDTMMSLKPGQRVSKFPGSGYITNKVHLAKFDLPTVPKAFQIPKEKDELMVYAKNNPSTMFVQKNSNHRGIKIEKVEKLDLKQNNSFVQVSLYSFRRILADYSGILSLLLPRR